MSNVAKSFDILVTSLRVLYNYFDSSTKLFLDLYLAKFLYISAVCKLLYANHCT